MQKFLLIFFIAVLSSCQRSNIIHPQKKDIIETVYASGKILSENEYNVFALNNGIVKEKLVREGDSVSKDQVLYIISNDAPAARLEAAKSNFKNAQSNVSDQSRILNDLKLSMENARVKFQNDSLQYSRLKNLLEQNATSKSNVDNALTTYIISLNQKKSAEEKFYAAKNELNLAFYNAKSQVTTAESDLNNFFIRSESNGTVFQTFKEKGEAVHANEIVALVGETNKRIIKLSVDQQDIDKIKTGEEVLLKTDITGNTVYHASISKIYPVMNEADQTFRVDAVFNDLPEQQFIHSSVEANIIIQKKNDALIIPRSALIADDSVQVRNEGKIKTVKVKTGITTLDDVEIIEGLNESSEIILPSQK